MAVLKKNPLSFLFGDGNKFFSLDTLTLTKWYTLNVLFFLFCEFV
jgi:hypothetical protein